MPRLAHHAELKRATRRLVAAVGGNATAAKIIRRSASQVQRYASLNARDTIRIDEVVALERAAKNMIVTAMQAHVQGGAVLALTHADGDGISARFARSMGAVVSLSASYAEIVSRNPNINQSDLPQIIRLTHEVMSRFSDLLAAEHSRGAQ